MAQNLLILDLDETLFHASDFPLDNPPNFHLGNFYAYKRPHLQTLLEFVKPKYSLAVWSSATSDYAQAVVEQLFDPSGLRFVWARERCTPAYNPDTLQHYWIKDLKKVHRRGYDLERVLVLDDSPEKLERHYGNWLPIRPFWGDPADTELLDILGFLDYQSGFHIDSSSLGLENRFPDCIWVTKYAR